MYSFDVKHYIRNYIQPFFIHAVYHRTVSNLVNQELESFFGKYIDNRVVNIILGHPTIRVEDNESHLNLTRQTNKKPIYTPHAALYGNNARRRDAQLILGQASACKLAAHDIQKINLKLYIQVFSEL